MYEINYFKRINILLKKSFKLMILFSILIGLVTSLILYLFFEPKYSTSAQMIAQSRPSEAVSISEVNANILMINTYKDLVEGTSVLKKVQKNLPNNYKVSIEELYNSITVETRQNSQVFDIKVTANTAEKATIIANETADIFKNNIDIFMPNSSVSIVSEARVPLTPDSPNYKLIIAVGTFLGALLGMLLSLIVDLTSKKISSPSFFVGEDALNVIGVLEMSDSRVFIKKRRTLI